jgi:hypothetical protein
MSLHAAMLLDSDSTLSQTASGRDANCDITTVTFSSSSTKCGLNKFHALCDE